MAMITWDDATFAVGIQKIDWQHKALVGMVNELHEAMKQQKGKDSLRILLVQMSTYALWHFATEEDLMHEFGYGAAAAHKLAHDVFKKKVTAFRNEFEDDKVLLSIGIMDFLKNWLVKHICEADKAFGAFLRSKGAC